VFTVLVKKEILNNILSFRFAVTFLLFFLLISGSVLMMAANHQKQVRDYANAKAAYRQRISQMRDYNEFQMFGMTDRQRPNRLSIFAMGLEPDMSRSVTNSEWRSVEIGGTPYANPLFALFSTPDVTYIVNIVVSLLAMLFVFDAVSGEREEETLKLMLSNPVPRDMILMGKCVGSLVCICAAFLISLGVGLVAARVTMSLVFTPGQWLRIGILILTSLLYISAFLMLGLFISTCVRGSGTSLMISLLAWVVLVLGIPNVVPIVARQVVPLESTQKLASERRAIEQDEWEQVRGRIRRSTSKEEYHRIFTETRRTIEDRSEALTDSYMNRFANQASVARIMSRISPSACFTYASTTLTGTGVDEYERFIRYVQEDFRDQFKASLSEVRRSSRSRQESGDQVDLTKLPEFALKEATTELVLKDSVLDIGLLFVYNTLFFLGAFVRFLRYDVK
jgi:ABC-type transport system involved in multi-copper enzyme maturation permease subunit